MYSLVPTVYGLYFCASSRRNGVPGFGVKRIFFLPVIILLVILRMAGEWLAHA
jgi:hypothetical protein